MVDGTCKEDTEGSSVPGRRWKLAQNLVAADWHRPVFPYNSELCVGLISCEVIYVGSLGEGIKSEDKEKLSELIESGALDENGRDILNGYYSVRLQLTGDMEEDVQKLYDFYLDRINDKSPAIQVRETIHEYISLFNYRELGGPEIVAYKIAQVGRKSDHGKRNLPYLIGCLRNVLEYGLSSTNSPMEKRLVASFETKYKIQLSYIGRQRLLAMAANRGTMELLFSILELNISAEEVLLDRFESVLEGES